MIQKIFIILLGFFMTVSVRAQQERKFIRKGNQAYEKKEYDKADVQYRKALEKNNNSFEAKFNIGDELYKQGKYQEAAQQFQSITSLAKNKQEKANIYHNMGNAFLQAHQQMAQADTNGYLQQSIDAYKTALKNNPEDMDTKYNLSYALKMLKKQQQQQKNKKNNKNQKNKDKKQQKQNQDNKNKKKQDQKQKQKQQQNKQDQKQKQQQQKQKQAQKQKMSKEDANRLLKALQQNENKLQEKLKKQKSKKVKVEKDW